MHPFARAAAISVQAAKQQGKAWEMHDKLFENYRSLNDDFYAKAAEELGLDVEQFKKDMASAETKSLIEDEMKHARAAGVRGTPTIFIDGKKPQGRSFELFKGIIDQALKEKKG
jgi:predicted DsbA family dithiol-disulfide isomerase